MKEIPAPVDVRSMLGNAWIAADPEPPIDEGVTPASAALCLAHGYRREASLSTNNKREA